MINTYKNNVIVYDILCGLFLYLSYIFYKTENPFYIISILIFGTSFLFILAITAKQVFYFYSRKRLKNEKE